METPKRNEKTSALGLLRNIWQYRKLLIVEPLLVCYLLPSFLLYISVQNLSLEKACRVNLRYDAKICTSIFDKTLYGIDCDAFNANEISDSTMSNETFAEAENSTNVFATDLNFTVCKAEIEVQKQVTRINAFRIPMSSVFPLIFILFAGGWSDRKGLRKPCMLLPVVGELLSMIGLLITTIFMDVIPMEFGAFIERVVPSMLGGYTLMFMGIFSYLTEITEENDRAFRFGIVGVCANIIQLVGLPFSGILHIQLGYIKQFIMGICILLLGIIYGIFFIPETKKKPKSENENGHENLAFETDSKTATLEIDDSKKPVTENEESKAPKNWFLDFFDPTSIFECIAICLKKRPSNGRFWMLLLVILNFLFIAPAIGEAEYFYNFQLLKLKWNGEMISYFNTYSAALTIFGTFLMTGVLIKIFKISDSMGGFIASLGTVISKPFLAFSKESILFYVGATVDLFISCKAIAVKSVIPNFVETDELGRLFSILGITEAISGFIFPPLYSLVYSATVESFPGAVFLLSDILLFPTLFMFLAVYFYVKKQNREKTSDSDKNGIDNVASEIESTRV